MMGTPNGVLNASGVGTNRDSGRIAGYRSMTVFSADKVLIESLYQSATELVQTFDYNFISILQCITCFSVLTTYISTKNIFTHRFRNAISDVDNASFPSFHFRALWSK